MGLVKNLIQLINYRLNPTLFIELDKTCIAWV